MKPKEEKLLEAARKAARSAETWADLSNSIFDPEIGLLARAYPTRQSREQFIKSKTYLAIRKLVQDARARTGLVEGATPKRTAKFVVPLPRSMHAALKKEAKRKGLSLPQLVRAKLAAPVSRGA